MRFDLIFNSLHLPFLTVPYLPFQKKKQVKHWNLDITGYWVIGAVAKLEKPHSSKLCKRFLKTMILAYIYQLAKFDDLISCASKDMLKKCTIVYVLLIFGIFSGSF